jgi:hypothetical protein
MRLPQLGMQSAEPCRVSVPSGCAQPPPAALPGIVSFASFDGGVVAMPHLYADIARLTAAHRELIHSVVRDFLENYADPSVVLLEEPAGIGPASRQASPAATPRHPAPGMDRPDLAARP